MAHFKDCTTCRRTWKDRNAFLSDPHIVLLGYQANFLRLEAGLFLFSHETPDCGTSLAIEAGAFTDLHKGPIFDIPRNEEKCPRHCLDERSLTPCPEKCECAYVRDVLQAVKSWPKKRGAAAAAGMRR